MATQTKPKPALTNNGEQTLLRLANGINLDAISAHFPDSLTFEHWLGFGKLLKVVRSSECYWRADWLRFGRDAYSPKIVADAVSQLELDLGQLKLADQLNRLSKRSPLLTREHHFIVARAKLDNVAQSYWLDIAIKEQLTARELEESIHQGQPVKLYREDYQKSGGFASIESVASQFRMLRKQIGELWAEWAADEIISFREHILPIIEFDQQLEQRLQQLAQQQ
jgi:hypothetical protein